MQLFGQNKMRPYIAIDTTHIAHVNVWIAQTLSFGLAITCKSITIRIMDDISLLIEADDRNDMSAVGEVAPDDNGTISDNFLLDL